MRPSDIRIEISRAAQVSHAVADLIHHGSKVAPPQNASPVEVLPKLASDLFAGATATMPSCAVVMAMASSQERLGRSPRILLTRRDVMVEPLLIEAAAPSHSLVWLSLGARVLRSLKRTSRLGWTQRSKYGPATPRLGSGGAFAHCMPTLPDRRRHPRGHEACIAPYRGFRGQLMELTEMNGLQAERRS